jgi:hypothetical protein
MTAFQAAGRRAWLRGAYQPAYQLVRFGPTMQVPPRTQTTLNGEVPRSHSLADTEEVASAL